jgi:4-diphosphocytidyl-2-C-methyl-D-erythritol kinase
MLFFPNAKINLGLMVLDRRSDGYHDIESFMYPVPLTDVAEFIVDRGPVSSNTPLCRCYGHPLDEHSENLCVKAYRLIRADFDIPPVQISLYKHIPVGAGLGGGSADGAFMLKALNEYFSLGITESALSVYALRLGSDCPFFIRNTPALVTGRGEQIHAADLSLKGIHLAVIFHRIRVSTGEAYAGLKPSQAKESIGSIISRPLEKWKGLLENQFEAFVFSRFPEIKKVRDKLYSLGAVYASMTGSGSAVYGLFREPLVLKKMFRDYFVWQDVL